MHTNQCDLDGNAKDSHAVCHTRGWFALAYSWPGKDGTCFSVLYGVSMILMLVTYGILGLFAMYILLRCIF